MTDKLIFDVGMHRCEDTSYFLSQGYRVVAVDADKALVDAAREKFADAAADGRLQLVNCAVGSRDGEIEFHLSEDTVWNSTRKAIANRNELHRSSVVVPCRRLAGLIEEYGTPHYCKIDVEGEDAACLSTLVDVDNDSLPKFISVETECAPDDRQLDESEATETLEKMHQAGYRQFKLVDQRSLGVIGPERKIYLDQPSIVQRLGKKLGLFSSAHWNYWEYATPMREKICAKHDYEFPAGASGPFGEDLEGIWLDFDAARDNLLRHRRDYFRTERAGNAGFWCDLHGTF